MKDAYRQRILRLIQEKQGVINLTAVSLAVGRNRAYMQQFMERGTPKSLPEPVRKSLAALLEVDEALLLPDDKKSPQSRHIRVDAGNDSDVSFRSHPIPTRGRPDLPVLGVAAMGGGEDLEMFELNGQVHEYVVRPPQLDSVWNGYAVYIVGESMEPVAHNGQVAYVNPNRPPQAGRLCVVQKLDGSGLVKEFVKRTPTKWVVRQYNPDKMIELDEGQVKACHYVPVHGDRD